MPNPKVFPEMPSELRRFFPPIFWHWWEAFRTYLTTPSSSGGGGPTSASATVVSETSFGQAASAGSANTYSRGNHTHGTPAAPTVPSASDTVVTETEFGQASDAGVSSTYSRGDHTHGTMILAEEGLDADKPAPTNSGKLYYATDTNKMYYDTRT